MAQELWSSPFRGCIELSRESALIVVDPEVCGGKPVIRGTRVPVEYVIRMARRGYSPETIAEEFDLPTDLVREVLVTIEKISVVRFA